MRISKIPHSRWLNQQKNSPISLDGTSEEPKESTRAVAPPSGSLCHLELSGGSPFEASKYTPGPNKAQAAKTFPKSFAEVAREAENSTGPRTPPSTSQKINKTATHHPQSPHMASSELGKNSRPRTAGPSFHYNSKFGTQGYPRNSLNETEQLSHVSPTPLDEVLKVVDPNKDNAAGHSSNSPQQTERLSDVPRDAQDMVEEGSVDPEALTSGRDVQHGAVRPSSGPGTPTSCGTTEYGTVTDPDTKPKNLGKSQKKKQRRQRRKAESALEKERKDKELNAVLNEFSFAQGQ